MEECLETGKEFSFKFVPEDFHAEEEIFLYFPDLMVRSDPAAGNNAMHMNMIPDLLVPGMENLDDPGYCTEMLPVFGEFQKGFCAACVKKTIEKLLVAVKQGIQLMWKSKYHMKVRGVNYLCPTFINPDLFLYSLTVRTVPVAAGIIVELGMPAVRALGNIYSEFS